MHVGAIEAVKGVLGGADPTEKSGRPGECGVKESDRVERGERRRSLQYFNIMVRDEKKKRSLLLLNRRNVIHSLLVRIKANKQVTKRQTMLVQGSQRRRHDRTLILLYIIYRERIWRISEIVRDNLKLVLIVGKKGVEVLRSTE